MNSFPRARGALLLLSLLLVAGCPGHRDPDGIDLETALRNTEAGEYSLVGLADSSGFISFQKSADHKRQYHFKDDREFAIRRTLDSVRNAEEKGHSIRLMGFDSFQQSDSPGP